MESILASAYSTAQLQASKTDALKTYEQLLLGRAVTFTTISGNQINWKPAEIARLERYIKQLDSAITSKSGGGTASSAPSGGRPIYL